MHNSLAVLPAGKCLFNKNKLSIDEIVESGVWDSGSIYVYRQGTKYKFVYSSGRLVESESHIGDFYNQHHDQTGRNMGSWELINIVRYENRKVTNWEGSIGACYRAPFSVFK